MENFEHTALPHVESVARFALALTQSEAAAGDLVQDTFQIAFRRWHTFRPGTDCRCWLYGICRNTFIKSYARAPGKSESIDGDADAMPAAIVHMQAVREGIAQPFDRIDVRPAIEGALQALPEPHRSILLLIDLESLSYEEAAAVLEIPVVTLRSLLYRARRHVQEAVLARAREVGIGDDHRVVTDRPSAGTEAQWTH